MKSSLEYLEKIIELHGDKWREKLDIYLKQEEDDEKDDKKDDNESYIEDFLDAYKEVVIENNESEMKKVEEIINNDLLFHNIKMHVEDMLRVYYAAESLRILQVKDIKLAEKLVDSVFEQCIIRLNPAIIEQYNKFEIASEDAFRSLVSVLASLSSFSVKNNLYIDEIAKVIYRNTRLSKTMCQYISKKIDENFEELRLMLIMQKLYPDE